MEAQLDGAACQAAKRTVDMKRTPSSGRPGPAVGVYSNLLSIILLLVAETGRARENEVMR
jgi:hypothetical protein